MTTPTTIPHDPAELLTEWPGEGVRVQIMDDWYSHFGIPAGTLGETTRTEWVVMWDTGLGSTAKGCIRLAPTPQPATPSRLPPEALASMPTGYKAAPWIVEGVVIPEGAWAWYGNCDFEWEQTECAGQKCGPSMSGLYAVPLDTPEPGEEVAIIVDPTRTVNVKVEPDERGTLHVVSQETVETLIPEDPFSQEMFDMLAPDDPFYQLALDQIREQDARTLDERATMAARAMREAMQGVLRGGTGSD